MAGRRPSMGQLTHLGTGLGAQQRQPTVYDPRQSETHDSGSLQPHNAQAQIKRHTNQVVIDNPLAQLSDQQLVQDVERFARTHLPDHLRSAYLDLEELIRAARVAKDTRVYDEAARATGTDEMSNLPVQLTSEEKKALRTEKDSLFSQRGMLSVILSVTLAAFLQGFVQSSINGASLYSPIFTHRDGGQKTSGEEDPGPDTWILGAVNAVPFLSAAALGCWMSLPSNDLLGRRGSIAFAAVLIFASSIGSAAAFRNWRALLGVRIINGIGMGIKAVSTPILASETAIGYWRGTFLLAWQLWVAFGILMGFVFNLLFLQAPDPKVTLILILGAPCVPCIMLLAGLYFCPESPRWYLRHNSRRFDPQRALEILLELRETRLQALRDMYLIYKSVQQEERPNNDSERGQATTAPQSIHGYIGSYLRQYRDLFAKRRLRNALISSSTVAIAQQFCGINVFAFYSGNLFLGVSGKESQTTNEGGLFSDNLRPMLYSLGFGAVNFIFALPAIRTIDTLGRRKWLIMTLPLMGLFMLCAALSNLTDDKGTRGGLVALFVFLFTAAYSPGLGPIPFTLASESFPLSHREAGCSFAIATNLFFAGLLSIVFPQMNAGLSSAGALGFFSGLCFVSLVLVFVLVEETKRRSLENLDRIFEVRKSKFARFQIEQQLPWFVQRHVLRRKEVEKPSLYMDLIWVKGHTESSIGPTAAAPGQPMQMVGMRDSRDYWPSHRPASLASNDTAHA